MSVDWISVKSVRRKPKSVWKTSTGENFPDYCCAKLSDIAESAQGSDELIGEATDTTHSHIEWARATDSKELSLLDRWAQAVGPPVIRQLADPSPADALDQLTFVVWNTNVGSADLAAFLIDLSRGRLTGGCSVKHFVLLLQEVHRSGPRGSGASPAIGDRINPYRELFALWVALGDRRFGEKHRVGPLLRALDAKWLCKHRRVAGGPGQRDPVDTSPLEVEGFRTSTRARAPGGGGCKGAWEFALWVAMESRLGERPSRSTLSRLAAPSELWCREGAPDGMAAPCP